MPNRDLSHYRKSYEKSELSLNTVPNNPMELFKTWFDIADQSDSIDEANAMTISTVGLDGFPRNRVVLLKQFDDKSFVFYTNYNSIKGIALENNPKICLSFFWPSAEQQIIIKGEAIKVSEEQSNKYFNSRPRGSQLGALVSNQSQEVSKEALQNKLKELDSQFKNQPIPRPKHWGGYAVTPSEIEFWQGRPNRLHDRILYKKDANLTWNKVRLAP